MVTVTRSWPGDFDQVSFLFFVCLIFFFASVPTHYTKCIVQTIRCRPINWFFNVNRNIVWMCDSLWYVFICFQIPPILGAGRLHSKIIWNFSTSTAHVLRHFRVLIKSNFSRFFRNLIFIGSPLSPGSKFFSIVHV